ncbi:hypothetical protein CIG75_01475 [Tumebacillus algifaecis]|uniref:Probable membrane transporter protein n=1 Tax=Tumebacillus algifaecis TaxID=1214604 RepID=A0A223CWX7_9BACL|nr:sulfite exporter TauE/SafE family protein [Tumebacillus algifaecis]ASS73771.1 hypothetical protein CIG75_01475 [Tumebacillus algifaecis]
MSFETVLVLFLIGFVGSFVSGLVGIGGSVIKYPLLLYVPPLLGLAAYSAHEVSGISAVQVFFATLAGTLALRNEKVLNYRLVLYMGTAIVIGSFLGAYGGRYLSGDAVNLVYGVLATIAAVMMFVPRKGVLECSSAEVTFNRWLAAGAAFVVGIASGIVGAAGAFLLVPIMLTVLKIPTRVAIASSLAITFLSSIGSATGKLLAGDVLFLPALVMVVASVIAAPIGAKLSKRLTPKYLQALLAVLILGTAIKIWIDIL